MAGWYRRQKEYLRFHAATSHCNNIIRPEGVVYDCIPEDANFFW